jgi:cell division protease FtsH
MPVDNSDNNESARNADAASNAAKQKELTPSQADKGEAKKSPGEQLPSGFQANNWLLYGLATFWISVSLTGLLNSSQVETLPYSTFISDAQEGKVSDLIIGQTDIVGNIKGSRNKTFRTVKVDDPQLTTRLAAQKIKFQGVVEDTFFKTMLSWLMPAVFFVGLWALVLGRMAGKDGVGAGLMSIGKSRAKTYMESNIKTTFQDIAGVDEAKEELEEIIGFLKNPQKYGRLGGHLPKGILLVGPQELAKLFYSELWRGKRPCRSSP